MDHNELIELIEAHRDGKTLQFSIGGKSYDYNIKDLAEFMDDFDISNDWRVKPEPREWHLWLDGNGNLYRDFLIGYGCRRVKVREVIEDE
jgi:hypothetical protein